jgi:hypothetical protein
MLIFKYYLFNKQVLEIKMGKCFRTVFILWVHAHLIGPKTICIFAGLDFLFVLGVKTPPPMIRLRPDPVLIR